LRTEKVIAVWKALSKHGFLSCPVLQQNKHKYYGVIELSDIVNHFVRTWGELELKNTSNFIKLAETDEAFNKLTVDDLMTYPVSKKNPFHPVEENFSLLHAAELLARTENLHRIPVVDKEGQLMNMLTQSQFIQFISKNLSSLGTKKNKPISEFTNSLKKVEIVEESQKSMFAFNKMSKSGITGVGVVNSKGELSGVLSVRDLKIVANDEKIFLKLFLSVEDFIKCIHSENRPKKVISVTVKDTLETVVKLLSENKIHRVFVVDEKKKPIGVVSLKDVLYEILFDE
jgi:5'-AMP-activated protein kinase, regulatory gamma subunit